MSDANLVATDDDQDDDTVELLIARVDALSKQVDDLREDLQAERQARLELADRLEQELGEAAAEREAIADDVADLDARTDLLDLAGDADRLEPRQREIALIQHLYSQVQARNDDEPDAATLDKDGAKHALHHCHDGDDDRTLYYKDMRNAADRVDGDTLQYDDGELTLDLEVGDLPPRFTDLGGGGDL